MLYHNIRVMAHFLRWTDAATLGLTSLGAWWIGTRWGAWPADPTLRAMLVFSSSLVILFMVLGLRMRTYHAWRTEDLPRELAALCEVFLYAAGLSCVACQVLTPGLPSRAYVAVLAADTAALLSLRLAMRVLVRRLRRGGQDYRSWLIIGHNGRTARLVREILANPHYGVRIDEIVDLADKVEGALRQRQADCAHSPLPTVRSSVVRDVEAIRNIVASRVIDEVVVTLPLRSHYDAVQRILEICGEAGISVKIPSEGFDRGRNKSEVSKVGGMAMVTHFTGPSSHTYLAAKRVIDVAGAFVGLVVLLPLFVIVAVAVRLSSPGPVFFSQTRVGLHGRHFRMIKFRSMARDAAARRDELEPFNQTDGTAFKIKNDPRVTSIGRFLRRFHLDELPQLWNVLVGDMSLVGPRPLPPREAHGNQWWQRRRLSMPPGLTCFWQVNGDHEISFQKWMESDLAYIDRWSVWLDLKLIALTLGAVARGTGW